MKPLLGLVSLLLVCYGSAQNVPPVARPKILGVAHIGLRTDNLDAARRFYGGVLGYQEPFSLDKPANEGTGLLLTYFKVNDHQYIEVFPELIEPKQDRLSHISFETSDAEQLLAYLASKGVKVPDKLEPMEDGNRGFDVIDPDGHDVEFIQYMPGSLHSRNFGKFLPSTRISDHIIHVGVVVSDRAAADHFYKDILGFKPIWHGGMTDKSTDWVDMRVPDGTDWLEYMLNVHNPNPHELGVMHHCALGVPSVKLGYETVLKRGPKSLPRSAATASGSSISTIPTSPAWNLWNQSQYASPAARRSCSKRRGRRPRLPRRAKLALSVQSLYITRDTYPPLIGLLQFQLPQLLYRSILPPL